MNHRRAAFTFVEMVLVILIMAIVSVAGLDLLANTESRMRPDRAAREALVAIRYARMLSTTTGGTYGVEFDTANARFQVFQTTGSNVVAQPMTAGRTYIINLSQAELRGTTMTATIAGDATNPYDVTFAPLGSTTNSGTVVFSLAGYSRTITIPTVGEPTIN